MLNLIKFGHNSVLYCLTIKQCEKFTEGMMNKFSHFRSRLVLRMTVAQIKQTTFAAGGTVTLAQTMHMMQLGCDGKFVFVGSENLSCPHPYKKVAGSCASSWGCKLSRPLQENQGKCASSSKLLWFACAGGDEFRLGWCSVKAWSQSRYDRKVSRNLLIKVSYLMLQAFLLLVRTCNTIVNGGIWW